MEDNSNKIVVRPWGIPEERYQLILPRKEYSRHTFKEEECPRQIFNSLNGDYELVAAQHFQNVLEGQESFTGSTRKIQQATR